jgi:hypothetical protein
MAVGALVEVLSQRQNRFHGVAAIACLALSRYGISHLPSLPLGSVFVLPDDIQMMAWIREHVPANERIAAPGLIAFKSFTVGRDAGWWIPFYTGHRTNLMYMAAGQEENNATRLQRNEITFTSELYTRDMSLASSVDWLAQKGYRYFFIGAKPLTWNEGDGEADHAMLIDQILRNSQLKMLHQSGNTMLLTIVQ